MAVEENVQRLIVQNVLKELAKTGFIRNAPADNFVPREATTLNHQDPDEGGYIEFPPVNTVLVREPASLETVKALKAMTPARIGLGRAGTRSRTMAWLRFLADHAEAQDAVFVDVQQDFLDKMGLLTVQTMADSREEHLRRPDLGCRLSEEAKEKLKAQCKKNVQVQIVVADGLSSKAVESNVPELLPALVQGLQGEGITDVGTAFFVKYGRVRLEDEIGMLLNAELVVELIGERPGLATANSLSAYIIYHPTKQTVEADRTVVSNIHQGGTPPVEAGAFLASLIKEILTARVSGVKLTRSE